MAERTADSIIADLTKIVESREQPDRGTWLDMAFDVVLLRKKEAELKNAMAQVVAQKKLDLINEGMSVARAEIAVETTEEYRLLKNQEAKIHTLDELERVAKKSSDSF